MIQNIRKQQSKTLLAGALLATMAGGSAAQADIAIQLDDQPLYTSAPPVQVNGRTLVPLRDIFEALGATVNWNPATQSINATKGPTNIQLAINNRDASVNGRNILLDQPATLLNGRTLVPLRFVAEATGADVNWNSAMQLVSIRNPQPIAQNPLPNPANQSGSQVGGYRQISIPSRVVIPVELSQDLSSATTRVGERFTADVVSRRLGDSEFPAGTKVEGIVTESRPSEGKDPGVLDFEFTNAILPDGTRVPLRGQLTSLDTNNVTDQNGRLVAQGAKSDNKLKVIGIGAGAGFVLGRLLKTNSTISTILGAAGGYLYSQSRERKAQEARLTRGTKLAVELTSPVTYTDSSDYNRFREVYLRNNNTNGNFDPSYYGYDERVAGRPTDVYPGYEVSNQLPDPNNQDWRDDQVNNQNNQNWNNPVNDTRDNQNWNNNNNQNWNNDANWNNGNVNDANYRMISIPAGAVVPVRLDREVSSETARVDDQITATVDSQRVGDSEFPSGTRLYGRVIEARPQQGDQPGVLDFQFDSALLPTGQNVPLSGRLTSLDSNSVETDNGRIVAKAKSNSNDRLKVIGIGAAAGFAIGRILGKDGLIPPILGALGGYLYSNKKGDRPAEAVLAANTRLGVVLDNRVAYRDDNYYASRTDYLRLN